MERFMRGDVVVLSFPFSDLTGVKKRPAVVVAKTNNHVILSQISSQVHLDEYSIILLEDDFSIGNLNLPSLIKPNIPFTANKSIIKYKVGKINPSK